MAEERVWIPMSDGTRLAATLYLPDSGGPWPVVMEALPYRKDDVTYYHVPEYRRLSDEGNFAVVRIDIRGTGSSNGLATDEYEKQEQDDLCEAIAWLSEQEWSNGNVGMYGVSYGGFNSIQLAMERPPALKAIVPIFATDDRYTDDVHYYGGVLKQLDFIDYPLYMVCMNALPPVPEIAGEGWRDEWKERLETLEPWVLRWLEEQNDGAYWRHGSLRPNYKRIQCPTMIVSGWADGYRNASFRMFEQLDAPKRLFFGPWSHMSTETSIPGPRMDLVPEIIRWFDRWLRDDRNGIDEEPPIVVFARRSTRPALYLDSYMGDWRYEPTWPPERARDQAMQLAEAERTPDSDVLAVRPDTGITAWISCAGSGPWGQPSDQRPDEAFSLVYDWPRLTDELEILGHPVLRVSIASSAPVAHLSVKLCDVFEDGTSSLVARGFLNLTHRNGHASPPQALEVQAPYDIELELDATSWIFEPGHRVRLDVAGTDWPNAWPPPEPLSLTVDRASSTLSLPVLKGPSPATIAPVIHPVRHGTEAESDDGSHLSLRHEQDVLERTSSASVDHGGLSLHENGVKMNEHYSGKVGVSMDDPGAAWAEGDNSYEITYGDVTVSVRARAHLRSDKDAFALKLTLDVGEGDNQVTTRTWERRFPRRLQ